jgi:hypothetical protein
MPLSKVIGPAMLVCVLSLELAAQRPARPPGGGGGAPPNPAIAYSLLRDNWNWDLMVMDADGANRTRLVTGGDNLTPSWSPDGAWIAFVKQATKSPGIYKVRPNGSGLCRVVSTSSTSLRAAPAWSPSADANGDHWIIYADRLPGQSQSDLFAVTSACNAGNRRQLTDTPTISEAFPAWSSDDVLGVATTPGGFETNIEIFDIVSDATGPVDLVHRADLTVAGPLAEANMWGLTWTRDGRELVVTATLTGSEPDLWVLAVDTPDTARNLTEAFGMQVMDSTLSPDQLTIGFAAGGDIFAVDVSPPWNLGTPRVLLDVKNQVRFPAWRPE